MKIIDSVGEGIKRSVKSWKAIVILWIVSLLLVSLVAIPVKASLSAGLGQSMVTETLRDGINFEVFADLGAVFRSIISYFSIGLLMLVPVTFLFNCFFTGGLFDNLRSSGNFSGTGFFMNSSRRFWSFFVISLIMSIAIILMMLLLVVIPASLATASEKLSEAATFRTIVFFSGLFVLVLTVILLISDYARAWQVVNEKNDSFKALGFGFKHTFRTFSSSFPLMLILLAVQAGFGFLVFKIIAYLRPNSGLGVFLLFIVSQILFFIRLLLKAWRYASVTRMMEINEIH